MQIALKQKLDNLRQAQGWSEVLIQNEEGVVGIHEIWSTCENDEGKKRSPKIGWAVVPLLSESDLPTLKKTLERLLKVVEENLVTTEKEISDYNCNLS